MNIAIKATAFITLSMSIQAQPLPLNLIALGDSLTESVPHLGGETEAWPFMVSQNFPGSTYVKLGYRGQTTDFLINKLDSFLVAQLKTGFNNVLTVWAGTND